MTMMNAAVVTSFEEPPRYRRFEVPRPHGTEEALVDVLAVGLHPRVRSGASGARPSSPISGVIVAPSIMSRL